MIKIPNNRCSDLLQYVLEFVNNLYFKSYVTMWTVSHQLLINFHIGAQYVYLLLC